METMIVEKREFIDFVKETADIFRRNLGFIFYASISSLPLFCFSVFFELHLQSTFSLVFLAVYQQYHPFDSFDLGEIPPNKSFVSPLVQTCLLYLFPYHFLDLLTTIVIVETASSVYTSEKHIDFRDLLRKSSQICGKLAGCLITSLFVLLLSTSALLGFIWIATDYYVFVLLTMFDFNHNLFYLLDGPVYLLIQLVFVLLHGVAFILLTAKYSMWSAGWNVGLVVSALEDQSVYGTDALELSAYYIRGNEKRGQRLMLVFFVCCLVLRMPCLFFECSVLYVCVYVSLISMGNVFKWVACVVYYHDCRSRVLEKKADEEIGRRAKSVAT